MISRATQRRKRATHLLRGFLLFLATVFLPLCVHVQLANASDAVQYIDTGTGCGGNDGSIGNPYCSASEWEAQNATLDKDMVVNVTGSETGTLNFSGWTTGSFSVTLDGWTTVSTAYSYVVDISSNNLRFRNCSIGKNGAGTLSSFIRVNAGVTGTVWERNKFYFGSSWTNDGGIYGILIDRANIVARNNFFYDLKGSIAGLQVGLASSTTVQFFNNTLANSSSIMMQVEVDSGSTGTVVDIKNNLYTGCTGSCYAVSVGSGTLTTNTNVTSDATSPQAGGRSKTITYVDAAAKDFRLAASETDAIDVGTDLSSAHSFSNDYFNTTRPVGSAWDIGAHEENSAAPTPTPTLTPTPTPVPDFGCGRDTSRNGSVDTLCTGTDQDADGYSAAQGDCDDTNFSIRPGRATTSGCSGGQWRQCKADGTGYTACSASTWAPTGDNRYSTTRTCTDVKYFSPSGNNTTGNGSVGTPWRDLNKISQGFATRYTPADGFCAVLRGGDYTALHTSGTERNHVWINAIDCTTNGCAIINYPGEVPRVLITDSTNDCGGGSSQCHRMHFQDSNKWAVIGLEYDAQDVGEGVFIRAFGGSKDFLAWDNYVHNLDGVNNDNMAAIQFDSGADGEIQWNHIADLCDTAASNGCVDLNNDSISVFDGDTTKIRYNNIINNTRQRTGIKIKKANYAQVIEVEGNYIRNVVVGIDNGGRNASITNNLVENFTSTVLEYGTCVKVRNPGGLSYFGDSAINNNTCDGAGPVCVFMAPFKDYNINGSSAADKCSGNYLGPVGISGNICRNTAGSFDLEGGFINIDAYWPDSLRADFLTGGLLTSNNNCWFATTATQEPFNEFASNDGNLTCGGRGNNGARRNFASWQGLGYDTLSSVTLNPNLATNTYLPVTNCTDKGYRSSWPTIGASSGGGGGGSVGNGQVSILHAMGIL